MASGLLFKRQQGNTFDGNYGDDGSNDDGYYNEGSWWWTPAGMAVRYSIVGLLFALAFAYFIGGYIHAHRRMRKGLQPLNYHRWMVTRRRAYNADDRYAQPYYQQPHYYHQPGNETAYGMQGFSAPPPAYNAGDAPPPVYQPPQGASKVAVDQNFVGQSQRAGESSAAHQPAAAVGASSVWARET